MASKTIQQLIGCLSREINYRRWVYAKKVLAAQMTQENMDYEIQCMEEIKEILLERERGERLL